MSTAAPSANFAESTFPSPVPDRAGVGPASERMRRCVGNPLYEAFDWEAVPLSDEGCCRVPGELTPSLQIPKLPENPKGKKIYPNTHKECSILYKQSKVKSTSKAVEPFREWIIDWRFLSRHEERKKGRFMVREGGVRSACLNSSPVWSWLPRGSVIVDTVFLSTLDLSPSGSDNVGRNPDFCSAAQALCRADL